MQSSICLFKNSLQYEKTGTVIDLPEEMFLATQRVINNGKAEVLHIPQGFFVIEPSEYGPFTELAGDWLPVKIYRIEKWTMGGMREEEFLAFSEKEEEQKNSSPTESVDEELGENKT